MLMTMPDGGDPTRDWEGYYADLNEALGQHFDDDDDAMTALQVIPDGWMKLHGRWIKVEHHRILDVEIDTLFRPVVPVPLAGGSI